MAIPGQPNYFPPRITRYHNDMRYDANVGLDGITRFYLGALTPADADALTNDLQMVNGSAVVVTYGATSGIVGGVGAPYGRNITFIASSTNTRVATITGVDYLGQKVVETVTLTSGTSVGSKKAYYKVNSISFASAADTTTVDIGYGERFGLPYASLKALGEIVDGVMLPLNAGPVYLPWEIEQTELLAPTNEQLVTPVRGYLTEIYGICQAAITTGGAVTVLSGTTTVTGLSITLANSDAAGTLYSDTATDPFGSTGLVAAGGRIQIAPAAAIDTAGQLNGTIVVTPAGLIPFTATQTATSYDPRGLFEPSTTPDSTKRFELLAMVDINNANGFYGAAHYAG